MDGTRKSGAARGPGKGRTRAVRTGERKLARAYSILFILFDRSWILVENSSSDRLAAVLPQPSSDGLKKPVLLAIKLFHTVVWALFVACILGIFVVARQGRFGLAVVLIAIVMVEVLVLVFNRMRCPLTGVAGRYTDERADNFDIYLPLWLARHNKTVFGALYLAGIAYTLIEWLRQRSSA